MRDFAADALGQLLAGLRPRDPHQFGQCRDRFEPAVRATALVSQLVGRLLPRHVDVADQVQIRHEHVVEEDLVEIVPAGQIDNRPDRDAR